MPTPEEQQAGEQRWLEIGQLFRDLLKEIERGQYDTFLERKWPDNAR